MKETRDWRNAIASINLKKVFIVFSLLITIPVCLLFYFVDEQSLLMSLTLSFMTLWAVGIALICGLGVVAIVLQILSFIRDVTKPIFRWFLH